MIGCLVNNDVKSCTKHFIPNNPSNVWKVCNSGKNSNRKETIKGTRFLQAYAVNSTIKAPVCSNDYVSNENTLYQFRIQKSYGVLMLFFIFLFML